MIKPDIIDIISLDVELKKSGQSYKGLCPFHTEKTPSFIVNPSRQTFHCFGCGERGDVIDFITKNYNLSFKDALSHLGIEGEPSIVIKQKVAQSAIKRQKEQRNRLRVIWLAEALGMLPDGIKKAVRLKNWRLLAHYYHIRTEWELEWSELTGLKGIVE